MGRRSATPENPEHADEEALRRRYRQLRDGLCVLALDPALHPDAEREGKRIEAIGARLERDAAKLSDPAERLALAERAYLSVFRKLPREPLTPTTKEEHTP